MGRFSRAVMPVRLPVWGAALKASALSLLTSINGVLAPTFTPPGNQKIHRQ
jgi:hypothetical protein